MSKLLNKINALKENMRFKKTLYWLNIVFLFLYCFSLPSFSGRPIYNLLSYFFLGSLIAIVAIYYFLYKKFYFPKECIPLILFVAFSFVGTVFFSKNFRGWLTLVLLAISFFVAFFSFSIVDDLNTSLLIFSLAIFAFVIYFFIYYRDTLLKFENFKSGNFRVGDVFDNLNAVSRYMNLLIVSSLYLILYKKNNFMFLFIIPILMAIYIGIATGSKAFLIVAIFSILIMFVIRFRKHYIILPISIGAIIAVFFILINMPFAATLKFRFEEMIGLITNGTVEKSTESRTIYQEFSLYLGFQNFFIGTGYYGFGVFSGIGTYAHANYAEMFCDYGIIGFLLFYYSLFYPLLSMVIKKQKNVGIVLCVSSVYLLLSFLAVFYIDKSFYIFLALIYCVSHYSEKRIIEKKQKMFYELSI